MKQLRSFKAFFTKQDNFSHQYKINFKGKKGKKTLCGAILSQSVNIYLLFFSIPLIISTFNYEHPTVSEHEILESRDETTEYSFANYKGSLAYGFLDYENYSFIELDPKYGVLKY